MSINDPQFVEFIKAVFTSYGSDYDKLNSLLLTAFPDNRKVNESLAVFAHFYYWICCSDEQRDEVKILGIVSLMEAMMEDEEYKDVFSYFDSIHPGENVISDYKSFKEDYLSKFGAQRKVLRYFAEFITREEVHVILKNIKIWDQVNGVFIPFSSVDQLARFLYQMRSDFVHKAEMRYFCPPEVDFAFIKTGESYYDTNVKMKDISKIFEKSFVKYWDKKCKALAKV